VPLVDLVDDTFVVATRAELAAEVHDRACWRRWWPDLDLTVAVDRGEQGLRWTVRGALVGSSELWLEPFGDGVVVHYYLRADLPDRGGTVRDGDRLRRRRALAWKRVANELKDRLERGRAPGEPRRDAVKRVGPLAEDT
jgi:hypothetical protein